MKQVVKLLLTAAALAALAVPAMAADKLIVKNATGTGTAFKVDDAGTVTVRNAGDTADAFKISNDGTVTTTTGGFFYNGATKLAGFGTSSPVASLSVTATTSAGTRGFVSSQHTSNAAGVAAVFRKSRGTEAVPVSVNSGDYIGSFGFYPHDGTSYLQTGWFGAVVRGTVSTGVAPTEIFFCNGSGSISNCYTENKVRLLIDSTGKIGIGTTTPTSQLSVVGLPTYDTVGAATGAGLTTGAIFKTTANVLMIVP